MIVDCRISQNCLFFTYEQKKVDSINLLERTKKKKRLTLYPIRFQEQMIYLNLSG